jgi:ribosome recycling factor
MVEEFLKLKNEATQRMDKTIQFFKDELKKVRTGRATVGMIEDIRFDYYGVSTPIKQAASLSTPDPHTIVIDPWDKSILKAIEKGIVESGLKFNVTNDGKVIRINIPPLTEETKKEYIKKAKELGEEAKIAIRNERRDINEKIKKFSKEGHISEDEEKKEFDEIQKVTDAHIKLIDELVAKKEKEIMEV